MRRASGTGGIGGGAAGSGPARGTIFFFPFGGVVVIGFLQNSASVHAHKPVVHGSELAVLFCAGLGLGGGSGGGRVLGFLLTGGSRDFAWGSLKGIRAGCAGFPWAEVRTGRGLRRRIWVRAGGEGEDAHPFEKNNSSWA